MTMLEPQPVHAHSGYAWTATYIDALFDHIAVEDTAPAWRTIRQHDCTRSDANWTAGRPAFENKPLRFDVMLAALGQMRGRDRGDEDRCGQCAVGRPMFQTCATLPGAEDKGCINCALSGEACSLGRPTFSKISTGSDSDRGDGY
jgi:hypothetical protein